ncbi:MAG: GIY-YIG nuclease family protein [Sulfurovaceae bacterium]|nr:GIY-YIG nuclease family protein [Sulfurovaceae bacterium]
MTTNIERRVSEHNGSIKGAKYTKYRRPVVLVYQEEHLNRSEASKREYALKKLSKIQKEEMISLSLEPF